MSMDDKPITVPVLMMLGGIGTVLLGGAIGVFLVILNAAFS